MPKFLLLHSCNLCGHCRWSWDNGWFCVHQDWEHEALDGCRSLENEPELPGWCPLPEAEVEETAIREFPGGEES